jgi:hypothetical protein
MSRKKKSDDDDDTDAMTAEGQPPVGESVEAEQGGDVDAGAPQPAEPDAPAPEQPPAPEPAPPAAAEAVGEEEHGEQPAAKRKGGPKVYSLEVSRNGSEWAPVAHSTQSVHDDNRDLHQVPVGYTHAQAKQVMQDWERAGYDVRLVEVEDKPEPQPEDKPEEE